MEQKIQNRKRINNEDQQLTFNFNFDSKGVKDHHTNTHHKTSFDLLTHLSLLNLGLEENSLNLQDNDNQIQQFSFLSKENTDPHFEEENETVFQPQKHFSSFYQESHKEPNRISKHGLNKLKQSLQEQKSAEKQSVRESLIKSKGKNKIFNQKSFSSCQNIDPEAIQEQGKTTIMIKNIPNKYTKNMLLKEIRLGFNDLFDFFYLQIDPKTICNMGFAFINFKTLENTQDFYYRWHGQTWEKFNSQKICELSYGKIQGKKALKEHFYNSGLLDMKKAFKPYIERESK